MSKRETYDVFLSHRYADRKDVERLHDHIERDLGYSVYVDWIEHPELDRSRVEPATAEHFRGVMRACSCLIFYAGPKAAGSRWMPWELGFFDGRQGARRIAVFVDDLAAYKPGRQEYLGLYQLIDRAALPEFLARASDDTAAMSSATYDQWQRHAEKLARDPIDYALSVIQWCYGASANSLLDPEFMRANGDEQPDGPLRQPAAFYAPWYALLRQHQAWYADLRRLGADSKLHRHGGLPAPDSPWADPFAWAKWFPRLPQFSDPGFGPRLIT